MPSRAQKPQNHQAHDDNQRDQTGASLSRLFVGSMLSPQYRIEGMPALDYCTNAPHHLVSESGFDPIRAICGKAAQNLLRSVSSAAKVCAPLTFVSGLIEKKAAFVSGELCDEDFRLLQLRLLQRSISTRTPGIVPVRCSPEF
jgi:hypothetical protein